MPLKVHLLNVGHGDCTVIEHPSGRLTMIDVNNSQDYDSDSLSELLAEQRATRRRQQENPFTGLAGPGFGGGLGIATPPASPYVLSEYLGAMDAARSEVT